MSNSTEWNNFDHSFLQRFSWGRKVISNKDTCFLDGVKRIWRESNLFYTIKDESGLYDREEDDVVNAED